MTGSAGIGPHLRHLLRLHIKYARKPRRYRQLLRAVREIMPKTIVEIGVYNGVRAIEMIEAASLGRPAGDITYFGFDLFESMTAATMESELSKWPSSESSIRERLVRTGARIELYKGFTQDTLPAFAAARAFCLAAWATAASRTHSPSACARWRASSRSRLHGPLPLSTFWNSVQSMAPKR